MVLETIDTLDMGEETILTDGKVLLTGSCLTPTQAHAMSSFQYDENAPPTPRGRDGPPNNSDMINNASSTYGLDERDFDKDPTMLFALIQKRDWTGAIERALAAKEEAQLWVSRKEGDGKLRWRLLPIHAAVVFKAPEDVVEALLKVFSQGAHMKDDQGMLPLHLAFRNGSSEGIVTLLLKAHPDSIDVADRKGRIPLLLAQASNSPHKEAYLVALEKGPAYYHALNAPPPPTSSTNHMSRNLFSSDAVMAEQKALYDAKLAQMTQTFEQEKKTAEVEAAEERRVVQERCEGLAKDLKKSEDTAQVLVDHVNSLEAQLNSRSDTERFLATKIATLDSNLKDTAKTREETETKLQHEIYSVTIERDAFKIKYDDLEEKHIKTTETLTNTLTLMEEKQGGWNHTADGLNDQLKKSQVDWANAQANCAILDAQLKKKKETEHALASQVSTLAGQLAEAAAENRDSGAKSNRRVKELTDEREILRITVQDLTNRLGLVARMLEDMMEKQGSMVEDSKRHDTAISAALDAHAKIVDQAIEQENAVKQANQERELMKEMLVKQEVQVRESEKNRVSIMTAIAVQGEHMKDTKNARDEMLKSVNNMATSTQSALDNIMSVIPKDMNIKTTVGSEAGFLSTPVNKPSVVSSPFAAVVSPTTAVVDTKQDDGTITTEDCSTDIDEPSYTVANAADRIMAARV